MMADIDQQAVDSGIAVCPSGIDQQAGEHGVAVCPPGTKQKVANPGVAVCPDPIDQLAGGTTACSPTFFLNVATSHAGA